MPWDELTRIIHNSKYEILLLFPAFDVVFLPKYLVNEATFSS